MVARQRAVKKLIVVFQPHRYSRTHILWKDFLNLFIQHADAINQLIITDIYAASEQPIDTITSQRFTEELNEICPALSATYIPFDASFHNLLNHLKPLVEPGDLVLMQGAGKMNKLADLLT